MHEKGRTQLHPTWPQKRGRQTLYFREPHQTHKTIRKCQSQGHIGVVQRHTIIIWRMPLNDEQRLTIWQQNVNKSPISQHTLISNTILIEHNIDILALQKPAVNAFNQSSLSKDWISIYPSTHHLHPNKTHTLTLICASISTDSWEQIEFLSGDITALTLKGEWGKIFLLNIYNNCDNNETIKALTRFHENYEELAEQAGQANIHIIWLGDFNRHHQY